jgi:hypothetical protein
VYSSSDGRGTGCYDALNGKSRPLRNRYHVRGPCRQKDLPVPLSLFWRHDLATVRKDHVRADVAHGASNRQLLPWRPVIDRRFHRLIYLFGREEHGRLYTGRAG